MTWIYALLSLPIWLHFAIPVGVLVGVFLCNKLGWWIGGVTAKRYGWIDKDGNIVTVKGENNE